MKDAPVRRVSQIAGMAGEQLAGIGERLSDAREAATDLVHEGKRVVRRQLRQGWERVEDATQEVERYIRRHPFRTALVALGAGVILGVFVGRAVSGRK
ncbi:MAG: DUF883 family protein [Acidobacteria bacterium]|nr:DUF883 family protein [Acidobacteriota bacterium]